MLLKISKLLTGDMLKVLCDMGHGDELVIADANFPAESVAKRLIRVPGVDGVSIARAVLELFPVDTYTDQPAAVMALTESDRQAGMPVPRIWGEYEQVLRQAAGRTVELAQIDRFGFYERSRNAYAVIQTGEERQYGNLILVKGVVL